MKTKCPHCNEVQTPNNRVGDIDICDNCEKRYKQFINIVNET